MIVHNACSALQSLEQESNAIRQTRNFPHCTQASEIKSNCQCTALLCQTRRHCKLIPRKQKHGTVCWHQCQGRFPPFPTAPGLNPNRRLASPPPGLPLHSYTPPLPPSPSQYHHLPRPPGIITPLPPPLYLVTVGIRTKDTSLTWNAEF